MTDRVAMVVITGFLGSGKTTLIAALLKRPELANTAVIINEFGEIGLDHRLIESSEEDLVELSTGCLCCVMRGDLNRAIDRLMAARRDGRDFDRIILETTGLAEPAPILQALMADAFLRQVVELRSVVVTVDAVTGVDTLEAHETSRRQAAHADLFLVTKTDIDDSACGVLQERLRSLNPHAAFLRPVRGAIDPAIVLEATNRLYPVPSALPAVHHDHVHDDFASVSLELDHPVRAVALTLFLQALSETYGPDLLRVKGIVAVREAEGMSAIIHGVQHVFHPVRWLDREQDAHPGRGLVLIGKGLDPTWIRTLLETVDAEVAAASGQAMEPLGTLTPQSAGMAECST